MIRKARIPDTKTIHRLLNTYAKDGLMLSRSLSDIYEAIRDFYVCEENGSVVGTVCLHICWEDLAEVRSLAVVEEQGGKGIGRQLVQACLEEARQLGLKRVFALTYKPGFFEKLGFHTIEKSELPHKIWGDCMKCAKFPECDEIAMSIELQAD
ncbi:MAG TPA: N-acetyltransferase [Desulfuromonadales bacterium]|jgi:amino-acid N-acetyltransferase|nr:N-acetyltransferase [Desulfuromonadales bacterium]